MEFAADENVHYGLCDVVDNFNDAIALIIGDNTTPTCTSTTSIDDETGYAARVEDAADVVYGLIHARFIVTQRGQQKMAAMFRRATFGTCPSIKCNVCTHVSQHTTPSLNNTNTKHDERTTDSTHTQGCSLLPVGMSDRVGESSVKLYCGSCNEVYVVPHTVPSRALDGAYFGTTFPHLLLLQSCSHPVSAFSYVPRIFGFRVSAPSTRSLLAFRPTRRLFCRYTPRPRNNDN